MRVRLLWDVDTQVDFVYPTGKLPVPGAETAVPAMARLVEWARETGVAHVASADDHELHDPELSDTPDYASTFPPHCLRGTHGATKLSETTQRDPLPLSATPYPAAALSALLHGRREILLLKKTYSVFSNPSTDPLLELLDPDEIILFGVATDICNDAAVRGLVSRGRRVAFVEDASRGLDATRTTACLAEWRALGVRFTTSAEIVG